MKKSVVFSTLCAVFALFYGVGILHAEEGKVDMNKWITITLKPGTDKIRLDFQDPSVWTKVTGVKNSHEELATSNRYYEAESTEIKVYGAITFINVFQNNAIGVDVSANPLLEELRCEVNEISTLNLEKNTKLRYLSINQNKIMSLDLKANTALEELWCAGNKLISLDLKANTKLKKLNCSYNQLKALDVSANTALQYLVCDSNDEIASLDLGAHTELEHLECGYNKISEIDVHALTKLNWFDISDNGVSSLDVKANKALKILNCYSNDLSELDVTGCTELHTLNAARNSISTLDVTKNTKLKQLWLAANRLTNIDLTANNALEKLDVSYNYLTSLDVSGKPNLDLIYAYHNGFSSSTLNAIYCQLPDRKSKTKPGEIQVAYSSADVNEVRIAQATNKAITDAKNWKIGYNATVEEIPGITGTHACGTPAKLTITPDKSLAMVSCTGGEWKLTITSTGKWKLDESTVPASVEVSPKEGATGATVTLKIKPNEEWAWRYVALSFFLEAEPTEREVVALNQLYASIEVTPGEGYTFPAAGETKTGYYEVLSPGDWEATSSNPAWFPVETKSGSLGTTKVTIKTDANPSTEERSTEIQFVLKKDANVWYKLTLTQAGKSSDPQSITVKPAEGYTFPAVGETKLNYFEVVSTGAWTVTSSNASWLPVEKTSGDAGTTQLTIKADANPGAERSTDLTFALKENTAIKQVVTLKQEAKSSDPTPPAPDPAAVEDVVFAGITLAPNPFTAQLIVRNNEPVDACYELINTHGVVMRSGELQGGETVLNTADLPAGVYFLRLTARGGTKAYSVVKE